MDLYDNVTSPIIGPGDSPRRSTSIDSWRDCNDGSFTECTISDGTDDDNYDSDRAVTGGMRASNSTDTSDRSVHFNETVESFPHDNSWGCYHGGALSCGCCYSCWEYIRHHFLSVPGLLIIIMILFIIIIIGSYFLCYI